MMATVLCRQDPICAANTPGPGILAARVSRLGDTNVEPDVLYKWVLLLTNSQGSTVIETSLTVRSPSLSSDPSLSDLTLSGIDIGTFTSYVTSYSASVANSVSQTTVTPTLNHSGAAYVIKLDGVTDADSVIDLSAGSNVITVEVTAEDGESTRTYTVTVARAAPVTASSTDATLSALTLSDIDFGTFTPSTLSYTAEVSNTPCADHSHTHREPSRSELRDQARGRD